MRTSLTGSLPLWLAVAAGHADAQEPPPLRVCATTPDLGSLCREIGGPDADVIVFARAGDDPHFLEARPSFARKLHDADALVYTGMQLEAGWLPVIIDQARNARVLAGATGHIDASRAIRPLKVPQGVVDRSQGDVHALGNPHYLLDPIAGLEVARLLAARFGTLRPAARAAFARRFEEFRARLAQALVGPELAAKYEVEKLALLAAAGKLDAFLTQQGDAAKLAGWLGAAAHLRGTKFVGDHDLYAYLSHRLGLVEIAFLEPLPGVPPTTRHLASVVQQMEAQGVTLILSAPYFDRRHAELVATRTKARVADLVHQCGARAGTEDYLALVGYNVAQVVRASGS